MSNPEVSAVKNWRLKQTRQCVKCPWRKDANPFDIPNGYDLEKHRALKGTIASPGEVQLVGELRAMACHEAHDTYCIGWLHNQAGAGNNIPLRLHLLSCENVGDIELLGEQHPTFEDTLPTD